MQVLVCKVDAVVCGHIAKEVKGADMCVSLMRGKLEKMDLRVERADSV